MTRQRTSGLGINPGAEASSLLRCGPTWDMTLACGHARGLWASALE